MSKLKITEQFIKEATYLHSGKYTYDLVVYRGNDKLVKIYCIECGEYFEQTPNTHLRGHGHKKCGFKNISINNTYTRSEFVDKANIIHENKYNYDNVIYINSWTDIAISCPIHGIFLQNPHSHLRGAECPLCRVNKQKTAEEFIEEARKIHGNNYDYSLVSYKNTKTKVTIIHRKCGRRFSQIPDSHLRGAGCSRCSRSVSKAETEWLDYLNIPLEYRHKTLKIGNRLFKPDAVNKDGKIVYEFNGDFWHGNPDIYDPNDVNRDNKKTFGQLYRNTVDKERSLKQAGYKVISIWESEWNEFKTMLGPKIGVER